MSIDADIIRSLFGRLIAEGFEPSNEARRLYDSMTALTSPDDQLEVARAALRTASLAGDSEATAAAQRAVGDAASLRTAWDTFESQRYDFAVALVREIYAPAFDHVRRLYDATGERFTRTITAVDPDVSPEIIVIDPSKAVRQAWADAPVLARDLERLAKLLGDVILATNRKYNSSRGIWAMGLLVERGKASVSDLALAWEWMPQSSPMPPTRRPSAIDAISGGRGGRWAALVRLGAVLRCPISAVADYSPLFEEPAPVAVPAQGV